MKFTITDLNGNLISNNQFDMNNILDVYQIDISKLISGAYLYSISIDGRTVNADKFIIVQ